MSLISKMLEDLDERQADLAGERDPVLDGLQRVADKDFHAKRVRTRWMVGTVGAALVVLAVVAAQRMQLFGGEGEGKPVPRAPELVAPSETSAPEPTFLSEPATQVEPGPAPDASTTDIGPAPQFIDRSITADDSGTTIILRLSEPVEYRIFPAIRQDRVTIDFAAPVARSEALTLAAAEGLVRELARGSAPPDTTRVVIQFGAPVSIESSEQAGTDETFDLVLRVVPVPPQPAVATKATETTPPHAATNEDASPASAATATDEPASASIVEPPEEESAPAESSFSRIEVSADDIYRKGLQLYRSGKIRDGMVQLQRALDRDPLHVDARSTLASCLVEQGEPGAAIDLLAEGLRLAPREFTWAELKAHVQVDGGDVRGAIETLDNELPEPRANPDYVGFLAALLQRENRHQEAADHYRRIVEIRPDNGIWWMGLGISLERVDRHQEAKYAYQQALGDSTLSPDLRGYISKRIISLSSR